MHSSKHLAKLQDWINWDYLEDKRIKKLAHAFSKGAPFPNLALTKFFKEQKPLQILQALGKEQFYEKESDLFKFMQTNDLEGTDSKVLKEFRSFLCSKEFIAYMQMITGLKMHSGVIDMHGSLYRDTDHLLCHDDQLEGRKVAFLFYLSTLGKNDGGALSLLASTSGVPTGSAAKIIPAFNMFTFFEVSPRSFHEVEEVVTDKKRIAIGGWFHG